MDVAACIIAVIQLTEVCLKLGKKFFGPSQRNSADLRKLSQSLYSFNGTVRNLQAHYKINGDDKARLDALNHLEKPLKQCEVVLDIVSKRLEHVDFLGQYVVGKSFDRKLQKHLDALEDARDLFELALHSDNQ